MEETEEDGYGVNQTNIEKAIISVIEIVMLRPGATYFLHQRRYVPRVQGVVQVL